MFYSFKKTVSEQPSLKLVDIKTDLYIPFKVLKALREIILASTNFGWFENIKSLTGTKKQEADQVLTDLRTALIEDEHVKALQSTFRAAETTAIRLLKPEEKPIQVSPPTVDPPIAPAPSPGTRVVEQDAKTGCSLEEADSLLNTLSSKLKSQQTIKVNVSWVIEEGTE